MISDAFVTVGCDQCSEEVNIKLTALAQNGSWDERDLNDRIVKEGWIWNDKEETICPDCQKENAENEEEEPA